MFVRWEKKRGKKVLIPIIMRQWVGRVNGLVMMMMIWINTKNVLLKFNIITIKECCHVITRNFEANTIFNC